MDMPQERDRQFLDHYQDFVVSKLAPLPQGKDNLLHMALGLCGEAGEFADAIKKWAIYGQPFEAHYGNMKEELADLLFYVAGAAFHLGVTLDELAVQNRDKLNKRYKAGFTTEESAARADKQESHG